MCSVIMLLPCFDEFRANINRGSALDVVLPPIQFRPIPMKVPLPRVREVPVKILLPPSANDLPKRIYSRFNWDAVYRQLLRDAPPHLVAGLPWNRSDLLFMRKRVFYIALHMLEIDGKVEIVKSPNVHMGVCGIVGYEIKERGWLEPAVLEDVSNFNINVPKHWFRNISYRIRLKGLTEKRACNTFVYAK